MKKIIIIVSALFALTLSSCVENEFPQEDAAIKLNLTILPFDAGTKVAKTDWADGDKIDIWFDNSSFDHADPDLVITYSGGAWTAGALREGANPQNSGWMYFLYEGYNDLSSYDFSYTMPSAHYKKGERLIPGSSTKYSYSTPLLVYAPSGVNYTFSSNTLTATLSGWQFLSRFKVLIKGLTPSEADKYQLKVYNAGPDKYATSVKDFFVDGMGMSYTGNSNDGWAGGVPESDGVAFYYFDFAVSGMSEVDFTLYDNSTSTYKDYVFMGDKTVSVSSTKCVGIWINYDKFN